jgi:GrpB-like predicted nucleotidyltransferase (UPF0157 family)
VPDEVEIVSYDPSWPDLFAAEEKALRNALPPDAFIAIEHAGSTAIPGVAAKPIIDIFVAVPSIADARRTLVEPIKAIGYVYWKDNPNPERMFFVKGMPPFGARRTHHVHLCEPSSEHWSRPLQFRDYLRRHPDKARRYVELKRDLAERFRDDREGYTAAKDAFVLDIIAKARNEIARAST